MSRRSVAFTDCQIQGYFNGNRFNILTPTHTGIYNPIY
jgi:hypothetical protein